MMNQTSSTGYEGPVCKHQALPGPEHAARSSHAAGLAPEVYASGM